MLEIARQFRKEPTASEAVLWQALRGKKLDGYKFRRQQPIGAFIVDFFCPEAKLIVEVDGLIHETQQERDQERQHLLESLGLKFVRVTSHQVETDLDTVINTIRSALTPLALRWERGRGRGDLEAIGKTYYDYRADLMIRNNQGLTDTYNRFH
ncbi:MAG: endonuclease domain-containing protein, partial [Synechococcaceae cyanobacterium SM2_3_1]|nr:endonuclease domain-containing protein [Synechococcaceae cyanobacterium SM2_3_1]